jgi:large subunit ribosomal protein L25
MDQTVVTATTGRELGSRPSKRLRAEGKLPAVLYGLGKDPVNITVDYSELRDALKTDTGMNTVLWLSVEGASETAMVREVQRDPIKRQVTHVDFLRVDPDQKIRVKVPITLVGEATAVTSRGGLVEQYLFDLEVECATDAIPSEIVVDQTELTLDTRMTVADLDLPEEVKSMVPAEQAVLSPVVSRVSRMDHEGEGLDGEGGESGGAEAAPGGAEASDSAEE